MQNSENTESSTASVSMAPVTRPSARAAPRSSSAAISSWEQEEQGAGGQLEWR